MFYFVISHVVYSCVETPKIPHDGGIKVNIHSIQLHFQQWLTEWNDAQERAKLVGSDELLVER